jgi:nucleoid DNA-binding protein
MRELHEQHDARSRDALQHANMRAMGITTRDARRVETRKCLTFAREYVSMHVMEHSNAAVARGEKGSLSRFGASHRTERTAFTGHTMQTAEAFEIAASEDVKLTATAGFTSAVN